VICEGQEGEEAVRGFLLPRWVMSRDAEFGFRLGKYLRCSVGQRRRKLQPGAPVGKLVSQYVWTKDSFGLVVLNCVSMVCTPAYWVSGLQIFSGASFDPMQGIGEQGEAGGCLFN